MKIRIAALAGALFFCLGFVKDYVLPYPDYFPPPQYDFREHPLDSNVILLGKALFYDPILSKDSTISCASCHSPYNAFAHTDHDLSHGIGDQIGTRNAPPLFNLAWNKSFMWDGAIHNIELQALAPIHHPKEMGETTASVVAKLNRKKNYRALFFRGFQDSIATGERLLKSLAQFQLTLISANAKYDQMRQGLKTFSAQELKGYELFLKNCNSCHTEPIFTNSSFAKNGIPLDSTLNDYGRGTITQKSADSLLFKIPSLRNLSYSYPYMHDGRFRTLYEVLNHYSANFQQDQALIYHPLLLSDEKTDLIAFLLTLNDSQFIFAPQHQFPKKIFFPTEGNSK